MGTSSPSTNATLMAARAAQDTATAAELDEAAAAGRVAGREHARTGVRVRCPYPLDSLRAHVWLRWAVHARHAAKQQATEQAEAARDRPRGTAQRRTPLPRRA